MDRYETPEWAELVKLQNKWPSQDILTITGFMNHQEFLEHLKRWKETIAEE